MILFTAICLNRCDAEYVMSAEHYTIYEDIGPSTYTAPVTPSILLVWAWPVAIGCITLVYYGKYPALPLPFSSVARYRQS